MKKNHSSRVLSLLLCLVMVLGLAACGGKETAPVSSSEPSPTAAATPAAASSTAAPAYGWKSSFLSIQADEEMQKNGITPGLFTENGFYAIGNVFIVRIAIPEGQVEEYEGQYDITAPMLYFVDFNGNAARLEHYVPTEPRANTENYKDFGSYTNIGRPVLNPEGNLILLETLGANWYEGSDEDYGTEMQYAYYHNEQEYDIVTLAPDGTELSRAPVDMDFTETWLNSYNVLSDNDGNLLTSYDQTVVAIAPDGSIVWSASLDNNYINSLVKFSDGTPAVLTYGDRGPELCPVDTEAHSFGKAVSIPGDVWGLTPGDSEYDFYYTSGLYLYGFRIGDEQPTRILNWMNCDINGDMVDSSSLSISPDGTISGITYDYIGDTVDTQIFTVTKVPADTLPQKQVLTVAQLEYSQDYLLTNRMVRFNRSHDDIRLEYKDYSVYNTPDDMSAGRTKFMTEVMAGTLPDIIPTASISYPQIASKGLLLDLYPLLDADPELNRDDFFPTLLHALEVNGGLYQVVPGFAIETLVGAASIVGDTPGWTYDEFYAALAKMPEGCTPVERYITRDIVLSSLLSADMDSYVDWTNGKVSFESDSFKQLLEFVKTFPDTYNWEEDDVTESTNDLIQQGRQMLSQTYLYNLDAALWNSINFGGQFTYIGWPTTDGVGSFLRPEGGYAISKSCSNQDAAWEFIRAMLTESGQADIYSIPASRKVFEKRLEDIMTPIYRKDANGNYLLDENGERMEEPRGGWSDETGDHYIYAMTQEQADSILQIIEGTTKVASYDDSIYNIVWEQAQAFFLDQKSVDEVARLIQSKANIYVNEQR